MTPDRRAINKLLLGISLAPAVAAAADSERLTQQLANPVANLVNVRFEANYDANVGPYPDTVGQENAGRRYQLNIQPDIPLRLNEGWFLISRTLLPVIGQVDVQPRSGTQRGLGDTTQSFFLSPAAMTESGLVWGAGPALLLPTGTEAQLSARKWAAGPTAVILEIQGDWVYGLLANHLWSYAGAANREDVSSTYLEPFLYYFAADGWTLSLMSETVYNWTGHEWAVPINLGAGKLVNFGQQMVNLEAGVRYWAASPASDASDWGGRIGITFLFPQ